MKYQLRGLGIGIMVTALLMGVATGKGIPLSDAEIKAKALELGMVERDSLKLTDVADVSPEPVGTDLPAEGGNSGSEGADMAGDGAGSSGAGDVGTDVSGEAGSGENGASEAGNASGTGSLGESGGSEAEAGGGENGSSEAGSVSGMEGSSGSEESALGQENDSSGQGALGGTEPGSSVSGDDTPEGTDGNAGSEGSNPAEGAVRIVIEYGVTSDHISELLEAAGLVEDAAAFDDYLCSNGLSRSITAGTYDIMPGTSEEEIIRIITKNR